MPTPYLQLPHHHDEGEDTGFIRQQLDHAERFQAVAEVFRQLADPTRIRVFWLLCHREQCVINVSALLEMSSPAVSHHLKALKSSGLIVSRREGREVYYRAADTEQGRLLHQMIEEVMEIACPQLDAAERLPAPAEDAADRASRPVETVRRIHSQLVEHLDRRYTIDELSRQFFIDPTTLKRVFKEVYGTSVAAHVKQHRMERAARLLEETDQSVAEIARTVGYDSQSRFTAAFKAVYHVLPRDHRRQSAPAPEEPCGSGAKKSDGPDDFED